MWESFWTKIIWPGWLGGVREGLGQKVKNVKLVFAKKSLHISFLVQTAVYTERYNTCSTHFVTLPIWVLSSHLNENIPWSCAAVLCVFVVGRSVCIVGGTRFEIRVLLLIFRHSWNHILQFYDVVKGPWYRLQWTVIREKERALYWLLLQTQCC